MRRATRCADWHGPGGRRLSGPGRDGPGETKDTPGRGAAAGAVQAAAADAGKEAKKEPCGAPKPRVAVFRLSGSVKETPTEEVFNFGGETEGPTSGIW